MDRQNEIKEIDKKIQQLTKQGKELRNRHLHKTKNTYRKERANRLIQTGALAEKYFDIHNLSIEEREELFEMFANFIKANKPIKFKK